MSIFSIKIRGFRGSNKRQNYRESDVDEGRTTNHDYPIGEKLVLGGGKSEKKF